MKHLNPNCSNIEIGSGNCPKCNFEKTINNGRAPKCPKCGSEYALHEYDGKIKCYKCDFEQMKEKA